MRELKNITDKQYSEKGCSDCKSLFVIRQDNELGDSFCKDCASVFEQCKGCEKYFHPDWEPLLNDVDGKKYCEYCLCKDCGCVVPCNTNFCGKCGQENAEEDNNYASYYLHPGFCEDGCGQIRCKCY